MADIDLYPLDMKLAKNDIAAPPSQTVSIIGFPYNNVSVGKFPIWKTGHIASDVDLNYSDKPIFLIDATTKPGMSGSPVILKAVGIPLTSKGFVLGGPTERFMGIYSGRIQDEDLVEMSNLGQVWKPEIIDQLISN